MLNMPAHDTSGQSGFAELDWDGRRLHLEFAWVGTPGATGPAVVFLHEGLGSVALWKDFPDQFCRAHGLRGLVFSRYGYGRSTPRPHQEHWAPDFMHRQAWEVLPALFDRLGLVRPWLFGHSDGASIALLHAARHGDSLGGIVVAAPHITVEDVAIASIGQARAAFLEGSLRARLAPYHDDVDSAFWGWNDAWLAPDFRSWDIRAEVERIRVPILAIQGEQDEYGTLAQPEGIQRLAPQARLLVLPGCGHSPHRDQPGRVIIDAGRFILNN
jgi:pimeloyl-ACP methyl ester carboxylesterase